MPPSSSSPRRRRTTLFNKDGISLFATILPSTDNDDEDQVDDNDGASSPPHQNHDGIILTLTLNRQQSKNVINPTMISLLIQALDVIDTHPMLVHTNNKALIVTGSSLNDHDDCKHPHDKKQTQQKNKSTTAAKFFSNGLDLEWMLQAGNNSSSSNNNNKKTTDPTSQLIESFNSQILARLLILPFRTIAAINGHCIGAGLFLSLACDYRVMRTERGYIQWPEANLGMRLTKGFMELSKAKIGTAASTRRILNDNKEVSLDSRKGGLVVVDHHVLREGILTAKRYISTEALHAGIIDVECNIDELYNVSFDLAKKGLPELSEGMNLSYFDPRAYTEMKIELWTDAYRALKFGKVQDLPESRI